MSDDLPADSDVRDRVRGDLDATLLVEAGAGTGKTTVLVDRILATIASGRADVDSIVVITFTEKAAAELSARIREGLEKVLAEVPGGSEEHVRIEAGVRGLYRARIETIHAFAMSLLRERPVEAMLDPQFEVLDDVGARLLFDEVYDEWLDELLAQDHPTLELAINRGLDLRHLREASRTLHRHRAAMPLEHWVVAPPAIRTTLANVRRVVAALGRVGAECVNEGDRAFLAVRSAQRYAERLAEAGADLTAAERVVLFRPHGIGGTDRLGAQSNWSSRQALEEARGLIGDMRDALNGLAGELRAEALVGVLPLVEEFVRRYAARRRERGQADFDDLLIWARDLLRDDLGVRQYFQRRYARVFIDEFQDTDPIQTELALFLTSDGQDGTSWRDLRPASGKLFLVGDPKQSIYRFRRADIAIYDAVKGGPMAGDVVHLTQNFRSQEGILNWVNALFDDVFGAGEEGVQAANVHLDAWPNDLPQPHAPVIAVRSDGTVSKADDVRKAEAEALAKTIVRAVQTERWQVRDPRTREIRPAEYRDVAILVPTRTGLSVYEEVFAEHGIPLRHEGGRAFFQRQEVRELSAILDAIDDPTDQISLVAALRSSAFACSDEEVFLYAAQFGRLDYRWVDDAGPAPVVEALTALGKLHRQRRGWTLAELVRQVLESTSLAEFALARGGNSQAAANVLKLVEQARGFSSSGGGALRAFTQWLGAHLDEEVDEVEASVAEEADDVVRMLTIHAAKGLEYPIACLANLNSGPSTRRDPVARPDDNRVHFNVGTERSGRFGTPGFDHLLVEERALLVRERERLLYVAVTRARDHLVIPVIPADDKTKGMLANVAPHIPHLAADDPDRCRLLGPDDLGEHVDAGGQTDGDVSEAEIEATIAAIEHWREQREAAIRTARTGLKMTIASNVKPWDGQRPLATAAAPADTTLDAAPPLELGDAVHRVMERISLPGGDDIDAVTAVVAMELGLEEQATAVAAMCRRCLGSGIVQRALATARYYREIPFVVPVPDVGYGAGRMDLLFREADELVVVDYKTDNVNEAGLDAAIEHHSAQAAVYAAATEQASRLRVREVVFVFARSGAQRGVAVDDALREVGTQLLAQGVELPERNE